jgi:hypothetical protein
LPSPTLPPDADGGLVDWRFALIVVSGGTALLLIVLAVLHKWRRRQRLCERCHYPRTLLSEQEEDDHLESGEQVEEKVGSVDYDVWWCAHCKDVEVLPYRALVTPYLTCEECRYITLDRSVSEPMRRRDGNKYVRVTLSCRHCHHTSSFLRRYHDD